MEGGLFEPYLSILDLCYAVGCFHIRIHNKYKNMEIKLNNYNVTTTPITQSQTRKYPVLWIPE